MAANRPTADVVADIKRVRRDLTTRTGGRGYTSMSENTVDATLARLTARTADSAVGDRAYQEGPGGSATITLTHDADGVTFILHRGHDDEPDGAVTIATEQLWQFAVGTMWRSYSRYERVHPDLSRLCSLEGRSVRCSGPTSTRMDGSASTWTPISTSAWLLSPAVPSPCCCAWRRPCLGSPQHRGQRPPSSIIGGGGGRFEDPRPGPAPRTAPPPARRCPRPSFRC